MGGFLRTLDAGSIPVRSTYFLALRLGFTFGGGGVAKSPRKASSKETPEINSLG